MLFYVILVFDVTTQFFPGTIPVSVELIVNRIAVQVYIA
jgi:hypothetical protein